MVNSNRLIEQLETQALGLRNEIKQHENTILETDENAKNIRKEADTKIVEEQSYIDNVLMKDLTYLESAIKLLKDQLNQPPE